jgi:hypothetical protein
MLLSSLSTSLWSQSANYMAEMVASAWHLYSSHRYEYEYLFFYSRLGDKSLCFLDCLVPKIEEPLIKRKYSTAADKHSNNHRRFQSCRTGASSHQPETTKRPQGTPDLTYNLAGPP